jgi:hypothetical protein
MAGIQLESLVSRDAARHRLAEIRRPEKLQHRPRKRSVAAHRYPALFRWRPGIGKGRIEIGKSNLLPSFVEEKYYRSEHVCDMREPTIGQTPYQPNKAGKPEKFQPLTKSWDEARHRLDK